MIIEWNFLIEIERSGMECNGMKRSEVKEKNINTNYSITN